MRQDMMHVGKFFKVFFAKSECVVIVKDLTNQVEWWNGGKSSGKLSVTSLVEVVGGFVPKLFLGAECFEIKSVFDAKGSPKKAFVVMHGVLKYSATVVPLSDVESMRVKTLYNL